MESTENRKPEAGNRRLRIGGMALENGVLFQTKEHWAMAIRRPNGEIEVSSGEKVLPAPLKRLKNIPVLRGLMSLAETATVLPAAHAHGGELPLLSKSPTVAASMIASTLGTIVVRNSKNKLSPLLEEVTVAALALFPTIAAMRQTRAIQYHAAEHKSINAYETAGIADQSHAANAQAEHPRCGSNVIGPAVILMIAGNTLARRLLGRRSNIARFGVGVLSLSGAVELVQWAARHPKSPISKILVTPGEELQRLLTTSEPTEDQLEVGLRALNELLLLEGAL